MQGLVKYKPFYSEGYNRVNYMLAGTRAITQVLHLPFVPQFNLKVRDWASHPSEVSIPSQESSMNHLVACTRPASLRALRILNEIQN
jgi:hypothetical protein